MPAILPKPSDDYTDAHTRFCGAFCEARRPLTVVFSKPVENETGAGDRAVAKMRLVAEALADFAAAQEAKAIAGALHGFRA